MNRPFPAILSHWVARSQQWVENHQSQLVGYLTLGRQLANPAVLQRLKTRLQPRLPTGLPKWLQPSRDDAADDQPAAEDGFDPADWATLPKQPGWGRNDWQPAAIGPIRTLTLHSQLQPDAVAELAAETPEPSPWRFEVTIAYSRGLTATIIGRLDPDRLRLLIRSDRALGPTAMAHLSGLAAKMRLDDQRPVLLRFDISRNRSQTSPSRTGVDQRA